VPDHSPTAVLTRVDPAGLPAPVGPYSHATRFGQLLFCSGMLALDQADSKPLADLGAAEQAQIVLGNLVATLDSVGASAADVARTTIYLADLGDYAAVNEVYREFFSEPYPARATVEVKGLIGGLKVEIDAFAVIPAV
jgi:2-iminobutanoate/2-iminopropanoate deaminase